MKRGRKVGYRKPNAKVQFCTRLAPELIEWLRAQDKPAAQILEEIIKKEIKSIDI